MSPQGRTSEAAVLDDLSTEEREWALRSEERWRRAAELARDHPSLDMSDFYHALRCLEQTPAERLAAALQRGRLRPHRR